MIYPMRKIGYLFIFLALIITAVMIYRDRYISTFSWIMIGMIGFSLLILLVVRPLLARGFDNVVEKD